VGEEAEIEFRWDKYSMLATRGGEAFDANSSCNRPLDTKGLSVWPRRGDARARGQAGRRRSGDCARVRDQMGGTGAYHFRLTWSYAAATPTRSARKGSGYCNIGGQEMNFTRSEIMLRPGGAVQISLYGDTLLQAAGRWRKVDDRLELEITNVRGMRGAKAQGVIMGRLEGERLVDYSTVSFGGTTADGKNLDVTFNAQ
jgi:hypothetical protein